MNLDPLWVLATVAVVTCVSALVVYSRTPGLIFPVSAILLFGVLTLVAVGAWLVSTLGPINPELARFVAAYNRAILAWTGLYALIAVVVRWHRRRNRVARG